MNHVRELRAAQNITQDELARRIGVSRQTIVAIEKGNYVPSVGLALDLAKLFHRAVEELFYWS